jgi:hypothetical protein
MCAVNTAHLYARITMCAVYAAHSVGLYNDVCRKYSTFCRDVYLNAAFRPARFHTCYVTFTDLNTKSTCASDWGSPFAHSDNRLTAVNFTLSENKAILIFSQFCTIILRQISTENESKFRLNTINALHHAAINISVLRSCKIAISCIFCQYYVRRFCSHHVKKHSDLQCSALLRYFGFSRSVEW